MYLAYICINLLIMAAFKEGRVEGWGGNGVTHCKLYWVF